MQASTASHPQNARLERPVVMPVVQQHAEESAHLRMVRSVLVRAPHVGLLQLARLDERLAAHLDGLDVAGATGTALCVQALQNPGVGEVFTVAVRALQAQDQRLFNHVLALVPALPPAQRGVASAMAWVSAADLRGVGQRLLQSSHSHERVLGLTACRLHLIDPGPALAASLAHRSAGSSPADADADAGACAGTQAAAASNVQAAALRAAAALGRADLLPAAQAALHSEQPETAFWAAWAACVLGDRKQALARLTHIALQPGSPWSEPALCAALLASSSGAAAELAQALSQRAQAAPADLRARRRQLQALGLLGDARFVPWLVERMADPPLARLAGECFSWITGADLARQDLETLTAPPLPDHPSDDPDDDQVALDDDESLPWPDIHKVQAWWAQQTPLHHSGNAQRLFSGQPLGRSAAVQVLKTGTQRRRMQAALLRCLHSSGCTLFPAAAPATRQRRLLAQIDD